MKGLSEKLISTINDTITAKTKRERATALVGLHSQLSNMSDLEQTLAGLVIITVADSFRLSKADFVSQTNAVKEKVNEIFTTERNSKQTVLDLSGHSTNEGECIDLAKHLSAALNIPQMPNDLKIKIANCISDLDDSGYLANVMDSPEYIAKILCDNLGEG